MCVCLCVFVCVCVYAKGLPLVGDEALQALLLVAVPGMTFHFAAVHDEGLMNSPAFVSDGSGPRPRGRPVGWRKNKVYNIHIQNKVYNIYIYIHTHTHNTHVLIHILIHINVHMHIHINRVGQKRVRLPAA